MTDEDFLQQHGQEITVQLATPIGGRRKFTGTIAGVANGEVKMVCADGTHDVPLSFIQKARVKPQFKMGQKK
jgi:ribosome maturation factor RimP